MNKGNCIYIYIYIYGVLKSVKKKKGYLNVKKNKTEEFKGKNNYDKNLVLN